MQVGIQIEIAKIRLDGGTQSRVESRQLVIDEYADAMREGTQFPAVEVFFDGTDYWLADGFHRVKAATQAEQNSITANVHEGTRRDAVLFSVGANSSHGLQRTNADKRKSVMTLLNDLEWAQWSDREIARRCGVSNVTVSKFRNEVSLLKVNSDETPRTYTTKHGTTSTMNTARIGGMMRREPVQPPIREPEEQEIATWTPPVSLPPRTDPASRILPEVRREIAGLSLSEDRKQVERLARLQPEQQRAVVERIVSGEAENLRKAEQQVKIEIIQENAKLPDTKYRVIYADPPWKYGNTMPDYFTEQADHYTLMTVKEICEMPISTMTESEAVLFLWVTSPILEESFEVIRAWGFKYKASFVWDKVKHNMGHYNSVRHELLLVATKGSCQPDVQKLFDSVVSIERDDQHSKKPEYFREIIDTIYPAGKRIELFARTQTGGWDAYGNQLLP